MDAPREDKTEDTKHNSHEELDPKFEQFPKYHMQILLGDFNTEVCTEYIFKQTNGSESLHQTNDANGVRVVNFVTSKYLTAKSVMFPHHNIHKFTRISYGHTIIFTTS
jgi:hypothetical protein